MNVNVILDRLEKAKACGKGKYKACCPAHPDKSPSLSIFQKQDGTILLHCFAGCDPLDILTAIGMDMSDLFPEGLLGEKKGWDNLKADVAKERMDRLILDIAQAQRERGERLTPLNLQIERDAYRRLHAKSDS